MIRFFNLLFRWPRTTLTTLLILAIVGWHTFTSLPVDVFPDISVPRIVIQTEAGGLSADEVERLVTIPIESSVNGLPGVTATRSSSSGGLSFVWIDFDPKADLVQARFDVFERLARITPTLPEEVECEIAPLVSVTGEIMIVALTADPSKTDMLRLREIAEYDLRMRLLAIPGIGEVTVMGGELPECRIQVDPQKLAVFNLDTNDIVDAAESSYTFSSAGYLANVAGDELPLRQVASFYDTNDLKQAIIPAASPLTIGAVAEVSLAGAPRRGSGSFNGKDAVLLSIQKIPGGNTLALTHQVEAELDKFENEFKDQSISLHREAYRQADLINASITGSQSVLRDAIIVVVFVLGLTLLELRTILIVLVTMPLSVFLGICLFPFFGIGINVMTLGGFAVAAGDIVDAAIIFTEVIWRRLKENKGQHPTTSVILEATKSVLPGVLSSTLSIILVFSPLLLLTGLESRFFQPFGLAYLIIFIASFVVSLIAVPILSKLLWKEPKQNLQQPEETKEVEVIEATPLKRSDSIATRFMKAAYRPILKAAIKIPLVTLSLTLLLFIYASILAMSFGSSFLPPFREDSFNAALTLPPGASLDETERISEACANEISKLPGVYSVTRRTGRAERDQHAEPVSSSEFVVRVDLFSDTTKLREQIRAILSAVPGASAQVGYPIAHRISAVLSGTEAELAISVYGEDIIVLRDLVNRLKPILKQIPGVADVQANREITIKTLRIEYHLEALAEAGITLKSAGEQVATAFNGYEVGEIRDGIRRRPIVIRLEETPDGLNEESVKNLLLHAPGGKYVKLQDVAQIIPEEASNLLLRENGRRRALISCNTTPDTNIGDVVKEMKTKLDPIAEEMGCSIAYGGSYSARENAAKSLITLSSVLIVVLFVMLLLTLKRARMAIIALISVPLGLMGGIFAVHCTSSVVSVSSLIGFVTVAGFTIRNGILLLNSYQEQMAKGLTPREAVIEGSLERMVPILMTSLTTVLGLIPIMTAANTPGGELLAPLAVVQFGGILGAMLLGLIVLPAATLFVCGKTFKVKTTITPLLLLLAIPLILGGCKAYEAAPIDWEQEVATWESTNTTITLNSCEDAALLARIGNPDLNILRVAALGSQTVAAEVGWWEDPSLDLDIKRILQSAENPFVVGTSISFTLPLSGALTLEARAAEEIATADRLQIQGAELDVATDARVAFHNYTLALEKVRRITSHLDDPYYNHTLNTLKDLVTLGEMSIATGAEIQRTHINRKNELKRAEQAVENARETLRRALGLTPGVTLKIVSETSMDACPYCQTHLPSPLEMVNHLKVKEQLLRLDASETTLQAEIRRQYPDLKIGPAYEHEDGHNLLGIALGIDLPLWNRNREAIARAETSRDTTRMTAIQTWRTLLLDATITHAQLSAALKTLPEQPPFDHETIKQLTQQGEFSIDEYFTYYDSLLDNQLECLEAQAFIITTRAELSRFQIIEE